MKNIITIKSKERQINNYKTYCKTAKATSLFISYQSRFYWLTWRQKKIMSSVLQILFMHLPSLIWFPKEEIQGKRNKMYSSVTREQFVTV